MSDAATDAFLAVFEALPRQGPGSRESTARALALCAGLPPAPDIVDLGCGSGAQSIDLAELTGGTVIAVDLHPPFAEAVAERARDRGVADRVRPVTADMLDVPLPDACADLVWSEGALYSVGLRAALRTVHRLLRPAGVLAFTDAVWRRPDPPPAVRALFADYPTMQDVPGLLDLVADEGFDVVGHFPLPDAAWLDDFYVPMRARVAELRAQWPPDAEGLAVLDACDAEIDAFEQYGEAYGYEFVVARPVSP